MSRRGSVSSARAMAMRWRCPPESPTPRSPIDRVVALGQRVDELGRLRRLGRGAHLARASRRAGRRRCCRARVPEKSSASCSTTPICERRLDERHLAHVVPVDEHRAAGDVVEARDQVDDGALARAGGAEQRHHLARLDGEADAAQDLALGAGVAEAHVARTRRARRAPAAAAAPGASVTSSGASSSSKTRSAEAPAREICAARKPMVMIGISRKPR